jgi:hypothetical protein
MNEVKLNNGKPVFRVDIADIVTTGDVAESKKNLAGAFELVVLYVVYPEDMTAGKVRLIVAPEKDFAGDWDLFGSEPEQVLSAGADGAVRTVQVPAHGIYGVGVRVTEDVVTDPVGGKIRCVIAAL